MLDLDKGLGFWVWGSVTETRAAARYRLYSYGEGDRSVHHSKGLPKKTGRWESLGRRWHILSYLKRFNVH